MAGTGAIRSGRAFVEIFADDSRLVRGLRAASRRLKAWGQQVTAIGAKMFAGGTALAAPIVGAAKMFASAGDELDKMSQRTGVSVEALSELGFAAEQSGADLATLEGGLRNMGRVLAEAATGSEQSQHALAQLGLSMAELTGLSPDEQFMRIADRISRIANPTMQAAAAMEMFGKSGTQLLPLLKQGGAGIRELMTQARQWGLTMSTEDAKAAAELGDALNILRRVFRQTAVAIGAAVGPVLKDFAASAARVIKGVLDWAKNNKPLIATIFKLAVGLAAAGAAIMALGIAISGAGVIVGGLATALTAVGTVLGVLLSPIGLLIAALVGLGASMTSVSEVGEQALSWLGEQFGALRDTAVAAWQGISDALAAGDIALAAKILWLSLKMEWQKGVNWLQEKWIAFKSYFVGIFQKAVYGIARFLTDKWADIQKTWVETTAFLRETWDKFIGALKKGWNHFKGFFKKVWVRIKAVFSDTDVEGEIAKINEEIAKKDEEIEKEKQDKIAEREKKRQERLNEIEKERAGAQSELDKMEAEEQARREKKYKDELKAGEDKLAEARRQWEEALAEAARKREELPKTEPPRGRGPAATFEGLDLTATAQKFTVRGTFSALAVAGLGGGGPADRIARNTEAMDKKLGVLVQQAKQGSLVFG